MTLLFEIPVENLLGQNFPVNSHRSLSGKVKITVLRVALFICLMNWVRIELLLPPALSDLKLSFGCWGSGSAKQSTPG